MMRSLELLFPTLHSSVQWFNMPDGTRVTFDVISGEGIKPEGAAAPAYPSEAEARAALYEQIVYYMLSKTGSMKRAVLIMRWPVRIEETADGWVGMVRLAFVDYDGDLAEAQAHHDHIVAVMMGDAA